MIEDLNKIRDIIETSDGDTLKILEKNPFLFKEDLFALCALDMAYTDLYAQKRKKVI
jgi:hypothetical protein